MAVVIQIRWQTEVILLNGFYYAFSYKIFVSQNKGSCINWHLKVLHSLPALAGSAGLCCLPCFGSSEWVTDSQAQVGALLGDFWHLFAKFFLPSNLNPITSLAQLSGDWTASCGHCCFHGNVGDCSHTIKGGENWGGKSKPIFSTGFKISISIAYTLLQDSFTHTSEGRLLPTIFLSSLLYPGSSWMLTS